MNLEVDEEGNLVEQNGDEYDSEDSSGEGNNDGDNKNGVLAGTIKKKDSLANENKSMQGFLVCREFSLERILFPWFPAL